VLAFIVWVIAIATVAIFGNSQFAPAAFTILGTCAVLFGRWR
jgi:hypothetical protein